MAKKAVRRNPGGRPRKYSEAILVAAALRVMAREGYDALSIRSLAKEVGTTHGTLYNYIGAIEEIEAKALHELIKELPPPQATSATGLRTELMRFLMAAFRLLRQHPGVLLSPAESVAGAALNALTHRWIEALQPYAINPQIGQKVLGILTSAVMVAVTRDVLFESTPRRKSRNPEPDAAVVIDAYLNELIDMLLPRLVA